MGRGFKILRIWLAFVVIALVGGVILVSRLDSILKDAVEEHEPFTGVSVTLENRAVAQRRRSDIRTDVGNPPDIRPTPPSNWAALR